MASSVFSAVVVFVLSWFPKKLSGAIGIGSDTNANVTTVKQKNRQATV